MPTLSQLRNSFLSIRYVILIGFLFSHSTIFATVTISGGTSASVIAGNPYTTLSSAITALNGGGALTSPVLIEVSAGHTETLTAKITLTASGNSANPIVIQKNGSGANPKLISYTGINATPSATADGMFALVGCDFVTIDGIDLEENPGNTTPTTVMEFGYAFFKSSATNGAQNNTIKNCFIKLNRVQNANWTTTGHTGSIGILVTNTTNISNAAIVTTSILGSNSNNKFYSNTISNCNSGIAFVGYAASSPFSLADTGNDIGGNSSSTGNSILNYGGATSAANIASGIFITNQMNINCSNNIIKNNTGTGNNHTNILRGITVSGAVAANGNFNNNIIQLKGGGTASEVGCISFNTTVTTSNMILNVNQNNISGEYLTATTGYFYGIYATGTYAMNIINDSIHDVSYSNQLNTGTGGGLNLIIVSNTTNVMIRQNDIRNIVGTSLSGYTTAGIFSTALGSHTIQKNTLNNISISGFGTFSSMTGISATSSGGPVLIDSNSIVNLANNKTSGNGALYGIISSGSANAETIANNSITQLQNAGSGASSGITSSVTSTLRTISKNFISSITSASITTVAGMSISGNGLLITGNKVVDISGTYNASPVVSGINILGGSTTGNIELKNNLVGLIEAPNANTISNGNPSVRGINILSTNLNSNNLVSNNSVYLNASSSGANFSSAGIFHLSNSGMLASTSNLNLRNNLIYNISTPAGSGITVAYQRGSSNLANYHTQSDRNLFYAGLPSSSRLIFTDTVSFLQTINDYKTYMTSANADQNSYDGVISFQSTLGSSNDFLKYDLAIPTLLESRASAISGLTTDFIGTTRANNIGYSGTGSMPDIGAWELEGMVINGCNSTPVSSTTLVSNANPPCTSPLVTLSLDVNYGLGIVKQWEESSTSATSGFTAIAGAINTTLIVNGLTPKWYRCAVTCLMSAQTIYSLPVQVGALPLSGTYVIDNTGAGQYQSFYEAINDLSCKGIGGSVIFNVTAGQTFNETNELNCLQTGSSTNTITFQKSGTGANPIVRRIGTINDTDAVIKLMGVDYYTFDGINIEQNGTTPGTYVEFGFYLKALPPNNGVQNNVFKNGVISLTANSSSSRGVFMQRQFATNDEAGTNSNNRFVNMTIQQAMAGYYLSGMALDLKDHHNEITTEGVGQSIIQNLGNSILNTSVAGVYTDEQHKFSIQNTEIRNLTCSSGSLINGISIGGDSVIINQNNIHDISVPVGINCITVSPKTNAIISNNIIQSITCTALSNASNIKGIVAATTNTMDPDNGSVLINNNIIAHLYNTANTTSQTAGIIVSKGQPKVYNNMISDLKAGNSGSSGGTHGIVFASNALSSTKCKIYFNSIYLSDSGANSLYVSAGISSSSPLGNIDLRNNIIVNQSNVAIGAIAAAIYKGNTIDILSDSSNNNLYYAGIPGPKNFIYYDGSNNAATLNAFKLLPIIAPAETNTDQENVFFQALGNGVLRPNLSIPTKVESNAQVINGIGLDFENDFRNTLTPDRGADEGNFTPGLPPCSGEPAASSALVSPAKPCPGVPFTLSINGNFNLDYSFQWQISNTSATGGFVAISGASNSSYTTTANTNSWYRCKVICNNSLQNKISSPVSVNFDPLSGNYLIDKTGIGNYQTFFEAFTDLECKGANGPITFNVTAGQIFEEPTNLICSYQGTSVNSITFKKTGAGNNPLIQRAGSLSTSDYLLKLNGADYIIFDGIDFEQTGTSSNNYVEYGIHIVNASATNGASNNVFKNGVISLTNLSTDTKGIYIQSLVTPTNLTGTNSSNRFVNMTVQNSFEGYRMVGGSTSFLDDRNQIYKDTSLIPSAVSLIQNIGNSTVNGWATGVYIDLQSNFKCANTEFSNFNSAATVNGIDGIRLASAVSNSAIITNNNLHNFSSPGSVQGIVIAGASNVLISKNSISSFLCNASNSSAAGIFAVATGLFSTITKNIIYNISSNGSGSGQAVGITIGSGTHLVDNNMISGLHAPNSTNTNGSVKGLYSNGGTTASTTRIYHNTIYLDDVGAVANYSSAGLLSISTVPNLDIRNNIIINNCDVTIGTRAVAFWKTSTVDNIDNLSNNNLWYAGVPGSKNLIMYNGSFVLSTLALYKASTTIAPAESNAVTENVVFEPIVNGVLRPSSAAASLIESGGTQIPIMTTDFENDSRNINAPDRGADEGNFSPVLPFALPNCATNFSPVNGASNLCQYQSLQLSWNTPVNGGPVNLGFDIYFGTSSNPPLLTNTMNNTYTINSIVGNTTYYWKIVPKNSTGSASGCVINSFTTSNTSITSVVPAILCGSGTATLLANGTGTINWYDSATNGNLLWIGNSYSNNFSTSTTYYVNAESGTYNLTGAKLMPSEGAVLNNTSNSGLMFNASDNFILKSVDIYTPFSGSMTLLLLNSITAVSPQSVTVTVPSGSGSSPKTIPLNFSVFVGTGWTLTASNFVAQSSDLNNSGFPYSVGNVCSITSGLNSDVISSNYNFFYNWKIELNTSCISPSVPVTATVTNAPPITITPSSPVACQSTGSTNLTATSSYPFTYYSWSPATFLVGGNNTGNTVASYNMFTTTYTVTATDGTCTSTKTVTHVVNPVPQYTYTSSNSPVCTGGTLNLYAMGQIGGFALDTNTTVPFIDITASGTSVGTVSDNSEHNIFTPSFPFNGSLIHQVRIGNNGLVLLDQLSGEIWENNTAIPTTTYGTNAALLAPYWDDLDVQTGSDILTKTQGNLFIIQFNNQRHHNLSTGSITYQVQIDTSTGKISFVYQDVDFGNPLYDFGKSATIGLQMNQTDAIQYSLNVASLANGKSISFIPEDLLTTYQWTGPAGYTSTQHFPTLLNVSVANTGTYSVTATTSHGCSVSTTIPITVNALSQQAPIIATACGSYYWSTNGHTYTHTGIYKDTNNCVERTLNVTIHQGTTTYDTISACDTYTWPLSGITYTASGNYGVSYLYPSCDTVWLVLTISASSSSNANISVCNSYTWPANGLTYTSSGNYSAVVGCHTNHLQLNITQSNNTYTSISTCNSYTWIANGMTYTSSGTYQNITGCDTQFLQLTILPSGVTTTAVASCNSYNWIANGMTYTASGLYEFINECDTMQLNLTIHEATTSTQTVTSVNSYTWPLNGVTYTNSGVYTSTSLNAFGCLHTSTLVLTITSSGLQSLMAFQDQSVSCHGFNDGSCQSLAFPSGNYIYQLDGGLQSNTDGFFNGLTPGIHTVCASDGLNTFCDTVNIVEPDSLAIHFTIDSMVSCHGNDGALSVQITGGTNALQGYLTWWINSNGDTLNNVLNNNFALTLSGLSSGLYHVVTEDDHGCFASESQSLPVAPSITVQANFNLIQCYNGTTSITPIATGGVSYIPYVFTVNGMPLSNTYTAGTYTIVASDAKGCTASTVITITQPLLITASSSLSACASYLWGGNLYTVSGIYTHTFTSLNGCDSIHTLNLTIVNGVRISPKVLLSGCYQGNGMMYDSLRTNGLIPLSEPYTLMNFVPIGYAGGESIPASMLTITGNDAIVDWVHVEIRSAAPGYNKLATMNALLQRDGDVVDVNGNALYFPSLCPGSYFVVVKHRNHLGVMSASALSLSETTQTVDFTTSNAVWTKPGVLNAPRKTDGTYYMLWCGDARTDKNVKYNGLNNDKESVLNAVGAGTPNNILYPVYRAEDVNMDARVKYNNADNDKNFLLIQVLNSNPGLQTTNAVISQHTPN